MARHGGYERQPRSGGSLVCSGRGAEESSQYRRVRPVCLLQKNEVSIHISCTSRSQNLPCALKSLLSEIFTSVFSSLLRSCSLRFPANAIVMARGNSDGGGVSMAAVLVASKLRELSELPRSDLKSECARGEAYRVWLVVYLASMKRKERPTPPCASDHTSVRKAVRCTWNRSCTRIRVSVA